MKRLTHIRNKASGVVHDRDGVSENRWTMLFGADDVVVRMCRPTYNAINDSAFELTSDPITCKICKKGNFRD